MINYEPTEKIEVADVLRTASAPLVLATLTMPAQPQHPTSALPQGQIDTLLCVENIPSMRWWLFVALFVWLVLPIGIALIYKFY